MDNSLELGSLGPRKEIRRGNRRSTFNQSIYTGEQDRLRHAIKIIVSKSTAANDSQQSQQGDYGAAAAAGGGTPRGAIDPGAGGDTEEGGSAYVQALMDLQPAFSALADERDRGDERAGSMDKDTFVAACRRVKVLADRMTDAEMAHLFMKVDVDRAGCVDWDKFTSFILTQQLAREGLPGSNSTTFVKVSRSGGLSAELDAFAAAKELEANQFPTPGGGGGGGGAKKMPGGVPAITIGSIDSIGRPSHCIERICYVRTLDSYVTCTQLGTLKLWQGQAVKHMRSMQNGGASNSAWVTDIVCMDQQPLAALALDRSITFYDTARMSLDMLGRIERLDNAPMCATWLRVAENDKLLYGDDLGNVHIFTFSDEWGGDAGTSAMSEAAYGGAGAALAPAGQLLPGMVEMPLWPVHTDWVTRIVFLPHAVSLLTASMDNQLLMLDLEKRTVKWSATEHAAGVLGAAYCRSYNFIVTCGLERHVNIWNPFTAKTMGRLDGHQSSVLDVAVNERDNQIVTVGADNEVKVWDMRSNRCLQSIVKRPLDLPGDKYAILYDNEHEALLIAGDGLELWQKRPSREARVARTAAVLYSANLRQVIVGDVSFLVTVWSLDTGADVFSFSDKHRPDALIAAMCLDVSQRRLLVASRDGSLRMWNFNNGQCLKDFRGFGREEVSGVACVEEGRVLYAAAVGWHSKVCIWVESGKEHEALDHAMLGHADDVLCLTFCAPNSLATAGFDGKIILWKFDGTIKSILRPPPDVFCCPDDSSSNDTKSSACAIVGLLFLPQMDKILISALATGSVHLWRPSDALLTHHIPTGHQSQLGPFCVDTANRLIFTTEKKGFVKAWDLKPFNLKEKPPPESPPIPQILHFRAHHDRIVSIAFIDAERLLLTGAYSGATRLWTTDGARVAEFGQANKPWSLTLPVLSEEELKKAEAASKLHLLEGGTTKGQQQQDAASVDELDDDGVGITDEQMQMALEAAGLYHPPQPLVRLEDRVQGILAIGPPHYRVRTWYAPMAVPVNFTVPTKDFSAILPVVPLYLSQPSNDKFVKLVNERNARSSKKAQIKLTAHPATGHGHHA